MIKNILAIIVALVVMLTTVAPNVFADNAIIDVKPDSPKDNDDLNCYVNGAQPGAYQYWWFKNGFYQPTHYDNPTISALATSPGDVWTCSVKIPGSSVPVGEDSVTVEASKPSIVVFLQPVNHAPVLDDIGNKAVDENQLLSFKVSASDPDGGALSFSASGLPKGASFNSAAHTFSWTPSYDQAGVYSSITISVSDGKGGSDSETITITVHNKNRPPVLDAINDKSGSVNALLTFDVAGSDPDKDILAFSASNLPAGATFSDVCTASWKWICFSYAHRFSWTPAVLQAGSYDVTFKVADNKGASDTQVVKITIKKVKILIEKTNAAPAADFFFVPLTPIVGKPVTFTSASADPDGEALSLAWDFNNDGLTDATGVVATYTFTKSGSQPVKLTANDGSLSNAVTKNVPVGADPGAAQCQDKTDNDGDGLVDLADPGCSRPLDNDESDGTSQCQDGKDNDGDGLIDFPVDSGCSSKQDNDEYNAPDVPISNIERNIENIECFSKVVEGKTQACTVKVVSDGSPVSGANVYLFSLSGQYFGNCITSAVTGDCVVAYPAGSVGTYTVYAIASLFGDVLDEDKNPQFTYAVVKNAVKKTLNINDLAVYADEDFSVEDYDFFRQETMYVKFSVTDNFGVPYDAAVAGVSLISPSGVRADFVSAKQSEGGTYYYKLQIPTTHDFLGDSQVFTFAFRFDDGTGDQRVAMVKIRNNPPMILSGVGEQFERQAFSAPITISLTPYESDVEDSGDGLRWFVSGIDPTIFEASVDADDRLAITPVGEPVGDGADMITLTLMDLEGDSDSVDVRVRVKVIGTPAVPACHDYFDNDFDGYIDIDDPGCAARDDNDEFNAVVQPQCNDRLDNDHDGKIDYPADAGCIGITDDSEADDKADDVRPQCSDGIDNDGDRKVDLSDPDCVAPEDNREGPNPLPEPIHSRLDVKEIIVSRIMLNGLDITEGYAFAGDVAALSVSLENKLGHSANRVRVEASVDELGIRDADVIDSVRNGQMVTAHLELEIPDGAPPGLYDVRIVVSNDDERRVKYRAMAIA
ncbi:PKD domain-containing protein [Candidatus Woesearchaeota archaeon]|nr:PKD domain-containing protein [Candidatus Woesearchaeota archaeon]